MKIETVVINRGEWAIPGTEKKWDNPEENALAHESGFKCCMGFVGEYFEFQNMESACFLSDVRANTASKIGLCLENGRNNVPETDLVNANDDKDISKEAREIKLNEICEMHDLPFRFEFIGEYSS